MLPVGMLMKEHRVIESMISLIGKNLSLVRKEKKADPCFIDTAVDFIRVYADKCHHGKEEDILFRELKKKKISPGHKKIMEELISEHVYGRETTGKLVEAKKRYESGDKKALKDIEENMTGLVRLYPNHIDKEDNRFFLPVMDYFSREEKDAMIKESKDFDMNLIHERYAGIVERLEKSYK